MPRAQAIAALNGRPALKRGNINTDITVQGAYDKALARKNVRKEKERKAHQQQAAAEAAAAARRQVAGGSSARDGGEQQQLVEEEQDHPELRKALKRLRKKERVRPMIAPGPSPVYLNFHRPASTRRSDIYPWSPRSVFPSGSVVFLFRVLLLMFSQMLDVREERLRSRERGE
eukprot:COSAG01_NODE_2318_length_7917_cov_44.417242_1_plen_173_part_00